MTLTTIPTIEIYGTLARANAYFETILGTGHWDNAIISDREKALIMSTRLIDRLNFAGSLASSDQQLQFPRGKDTTVPLDIEYACYEITLILLSGFDLEQETISLGVSSDAFSGVRTTYDSNTHMEHIRAGIPSITAWNYLKPYLSDPRQVLISRVN
jgi:hypothetical protein